MNKGSAVIIPQEATPQLVSFLELSCFTPQEQPRLTRGAVVFRLFSVGRALGAKLDVTFTADYGLYYGHDDYMLLEHLELAAPHIDWRTGKMFHRWHDQSRIQIFCADTGKCVAQIETRRYMGRKVVAAEVERGLHGENVLTLDQCRALRMQQMAARLAADREAKDADK